MKRLPGFALLVVGTALYAGPPLWTAPALAQTTSAQVPTKGLLDRIEAVQQRARDVVALDGRPETRRTVASYEWNPGTIQMPCQWCAVSLDAQKDACLARVNDAIAKDDPLAPVTSPYGSDAIASWCSPMSRTDQVRATNVGVMVAMAKNLARSAAPFNGPLSARDNDWVAAHDWNVALAEKLIARAKEQAQAAAGALAKRQTQMQVESSVIQAATTACTPTPGACEAKCKSGDGPSCVTWATRLWRSAPPRLAEARAAMQRGCDAGTLTACATVPQVDADLQTATAKMDELWGSVADAGDEIAHKKYEAQFARSMEATMPPAHQLQTEHAIQRLTIYTSAVVQEKYCPAKKAFIAQASAGEFSKRAVAHCKDSAPVGNGQGGVQVTLTAQCQAAYASPCP